MDAAGIDAISIHPPSWDRDSKEIAMAVARAHPTGSRSVASPEHAQSRELADGGKRCPGMFGLRCVFRQGHENLADRTGDRARGTAVALLAADFRPLIGYIADRPGPQDESSITWRPAVMRAQVGDAALAGSCSELAPSRIREWPANAGGR